MTKVIDAIDRIVHEANEAAQRQKAERLSVKEAAAQPRSDLARGLRTLASQLRADDGGQP